MADITDPYTNRFLTALVRPAANQILGIVMSQSYADRTWTEAEIGLDAAGVELDDKLLDSSPIDGTGTLSRRNVDKIMAAWLAIKALADDAATMKALTLASTEIDLPG